jgi:hypothetical protein
MKDEFFLPEEVMEWVAQKKSEYLATLITNHKSDDIKIEEYHQFNYLMEETIARSDKSYSDEVDGNRLNIYVKSYGHGTQVVVGAVYPDPNKNSDIFVPVLTFMSKDNDLIKLFAVGKPLSSPILN